MIDTHCHLDFKVFDNDRESVLQAAKNNGISDIIIPSILLDNWASVKQLTEHYQQPKLHPAYGLHPMFSKKQKEEDIAVLESWIQTEKPIAIGECGLDFFIDDFQQAKQLYLFEAQVKLACQYDLPLIIHARKSLDIVLKILRKYPSSRGVIHSFSGSEQQAYQAIKLGFYLGFGGVISFTRAKKLRRLVANLPLEYLLLETDAPDQSDAQHYGLRNEPAWLIHVAETFAELRHDNIENIAKITTSNAKKLFSRL